MLEFKYDVQLLIDFYMHEGFRLIGMDTCCYTNNDLHRKEVRLEFGWFTEDE